MRNTLSRLRRAKGARCKIKELGVPRLSVHRTARHIYAQLIMPDGRVLAAASTLDSALRQQLTSGGNKDAARAVGALIASRISELGMTKVAFDRSGFKYHGRIKELADAARAGGLEL